MRVNHVPLRLCVGCQGRDAKRTMDRFTAPSGRLAWDGRKPAPGRGAYLHRTPECRSTFLSRKGPLRSLHASFGRAERGRFLDEATEVS